MIKYIIAPYTHKVKRDKELITTHTDFKDYLNRLKYLTKYNKLMGVEIRMLNDVTFETHTVYLDNKKLKKSINYIFYGK